MEIILEILSAVLLTYPGGFIRWVIFRRKSLKDYCEDTISYNFLASSIVIAVIFITIKFINM
jgi:hypothetical protein